jgi:hypothetical protein
MTSPKDNGANITGMAEALFRVAPIADDATKLLTCGLLVRCLL